MADSKKILIVEDDDFLAKIYNKELLKEGYLSEVVNSGPKALSALQSQDYDLILLDIMMPGMDGLTVLERIRKDGKTSKTPVVVLSNLSEDSTVKRALALGANGYLLKAQYLPHQAVAEIKKFL